MYQETFLYPYGSFRPWRLEPNTSVPYLLQPIVSSKYISIFFFFIYNILAPTTYKSTITIPTIYLIFHTSILYNNRLFIKIIDPYEKKNNWTYKKKYHCY